MKKFLLKSLALCLILGLSFSCVACNNSSNKNIVQDIDVDVEKEEEEELDRNEGIIDPDSEDDFHDFFPVIDPDDIT